MIIWIALAGLALAAIVLVATHDAGTVLGMASEQFARVAALSALAVVVGASLFWQFRGRLADTLRMAAIWILVAAVLIVGYAYRHDAEDVYRRVIAELIPGTTFEVDGGHVAIARSGNGHFVIDTAVNGAPVTMLFDTGASTVVLTPEAAARAGIDVGALTYSVQVSTANGRTTAAPVILEEIAVGSIRVARVRAVVSRPGNLGESLLGMSFLDRIPTWRVEHDRLILGG